MFRKTMFVALLGGGLANSELRAQDLSTDTSASSPEQSSVALPSGEVVSPATQVSPDDFTVRAGSEPMLPVFDLGRRMQFTATVLGGYDDNVNLTPTPEPSWFIGPAASFTYLFGSPRLALSLLSTAGLTYYFDHPGGRDYDPNIQLRLLVSYKATARLTLHFATTTGYQSQPDLSTALSVNRRVGSFFRTSDRFSADYRFTPRLSTITSYTFSALEFESSEGAASDRMEHSFAEAIRYLLFPTTTTTAEYGLTLVDSAETAADSTTHTLMAGIDQSFSPRLTGLLRGGVQFRSSDNGAGRTSPYGEATIHYALAPTTVAGAITAGQTAVPGAALGKTQLGSAIIWSNRYSIEESDVPSAGGRETFRTNLQFAYAITARIGATIAVSYLHGENEGSRTSQTGLVHSSGQDVFDIAPAIRYAITPNVTVTAGYRHSENDRAAVANQNGQIGTFSFSRNRYFAGINITF